MHGTSNEDRTGKSWRARPLRKVVCRAWGVGESAKVESAKLVRGASLLLAVFAEFTPQGVKMNEYRRLAITNMSFHNR